MNDIYRFKSNQPVVWYDDSLSKSNQYCLYCGRFVGEGSKVASNKEHLIGRQFIPSGEFGIGTSFNFIFRACRTCNAEKGKVEGHISSVTLFTGPEKHSSQTHKDLACRKAAKEYHPDKKQTLIKDSSDSLRIVGTFGGAGINFGISGPPQAARGYSEFLAFRHIQGIFSLITSHHPHTSDGTSLLDCRYFHLFGLYNHTDWGNQHLLEIMDRVQFTNCYANIHTANGFFKAIMRRTDGKNGEWFWALEWNKSCRLVGAIAQPNRTPVVFEGLPTLNWKKHAIQDKQETIIRKEIPLELHQDILFLGKVEGQ